MKNKLAARVQAISNDCMSESTGNVKKKVDLTKSLQVKVAALGLAAFVALGAAPSMAQSQAQPQIENATVQQKAPSVKTLARLQEMGALKLMRTGMDLKSALYHNDSNQIKQAKQQMHSAIKSLSDNTNALKEFAPNTQRAEVINNRLAEKLDQLSKAVDRSVHTYDQSNEIELTSLVAEARGISSHLEGMFPDPWADLEAQAQASASSVFNR